MTSVVERALEMARSGNYQWVNEIVRDLEKAGHDKVQQHLDGKFTRRQILAAIKYAKSEALDTRPEQNRVFVQG